MRPLVVATVLVASAAVMTVSPVKADPVYIALGDSVTFGETDLRYVPSFGDRGYVSRVADQLEATGGQRPTVVNFAIDGETASSFMTGSGRLPPVVGRNDAILAEQNLNYAGRPATPQQTMFLQEVAAQQAAGNTIDTVTMSLGFNDLFMLAGMPNGADLIAPTLAAYREDYAAILTTIRQVLPGTDLFLLNYYNPFVADPGNPAAPIAAIGGPQLNAIIAELAAEFDAFYVDTFTPFVGREAELTYIDEMPHGFVIEPPHGGVLPIGNAHANEAGYEVIASQVLAATPTESVPEPSALLLLGPAVAFGLALRVRRRPTH